MHFTTTPNTTTIQKSTMSSIAAATTTTTTKLNQCDACGMPKTKKNWGVAFIERQRRTSASLIPDEVGWRCYYCSNREENVNVGSLTPSLYRTKTICVGSFQRNNGSNEWAVVNIYALLLHNLRLCVGVYVWVSPPPRTNLLSPL